MALVRLGSGLGRIRVPKPRKSSVMANVCFSLGLLVCLFFALSAILSTGREYSSRGTCMVCPYECVDVQQYLPRCA